MTRTRYLFSAPAMALLTAAQAVLGIIAIAATRADAVAEDAMWRVDGWRREIPSGHGRDEFDAAVADMLMGIALGAVTAAAAFAAGSLCAFIMIAIGG